ncbi:MAG: hypothetical protein KGJ02_00955 [Verrucomicrobiota bacterium]|nr:hypothetical protein [Verrucomicrobiota bacterium]
MSSEIGTNVERIKSPLPEETHPWEDIEDENKDPDSKLHTAIDIIDNYPSQQASGASLANRNIGPIEPPSMSNDPKKAQSAPAPLETAASQHDLRPLPTSRIQKAWNSFRQSFRCCWCLTADIKDE